jgi:hypothetical protein
MPSLPNNRGSSVEVVTLEIMIIYLTTYFGYDLSQELHKLRTQTNYKVGRAPFEFLADFNINETRHLYYIRHSLCVSFSFYLIARAMSLIDLNTFNR